MELLRLITCGSVDDGKSTLIGRLFYDSKALQRDLLEAIAESSRRNGSERVNLALLTDGLKAEREQGITIDVAHKYFTNGQRKFIIADTPGHVQYTRNMVTAASAAQAAIILVDASKGIVEQTRRHTYIAAQLNLPHVLLAVNKMDLLDFSEDAFQKIRAEFQLLAASSAIRDHYAIPLSALEGDNVVHPSQNMAWYQGPTLMRYLNELQIEEYGDQSSCRFPVQWVVRPQSGRFPSYRAYSGQIASGLFRKGATIRALPSGALSTIQAIEFAGKEMEQAAPPLSVSLLLKDELDISRGDMLVSPDHEPVVGQKISARLCWMHEDELKSGARLILRHTSRETDARIGPIISRTNIRTLEEEKGADSLALNELGLVELRTASPIFYDPYQDNRITGSFILIDPASYATVAAGMITGEKRQITGEKPKPSVGLCKIL